MLLTSYPTLRRRGPRGARSRPYIEELETRCLLSVAAPAALLPEQEGNDTVDQAQPLGVPLAVEPAVEGHEGGPQPAGRGFGLAPGPGPGALGVLEEAKGHRGQHRRLGYARGGRVPGPAPQVGVGEAAARGPVGQDVGHEAVGGLTPQHRLQLPPGPGAVDGRPPQGDEARVPQPLVGIHVGGGHGVVAPVVGLQDLAGRAPHPVSRAPTAGRSARRR